MHIALRALLRASTSVEVRILNEQKYSGFFLGNHLCMNMCIQNCSGIREKIRLVFYSISIVNLCPSGQKFTDLVDLSVS